jgi:hypothetical protein
MSHIHLDMDQIDKNTAKQAEELGKNASSPGGEGVYARMCLACFVPFSRQLAIEINSGTPFEQMEASLSLMAASMAATLYGCAGEVSDPMLDASDFMRFLTLLVNDIRRAIADNGGGSSVFVVAPTPSGRA